MVSLNGRQELTLVIGALVCVALCLFLLPWRWTEADGERAEFGGFGPLYEPPARFARNLREGRLGYAVIPPRRHLQVDLPMLGVELAAVALITAGVALALRGREPD